MSRGGKRAELEWDELGRLECDPDPEGGSCSAVIPLQGLSPSVRAGGGALTVTVGATKLVGGWVGGRLMGTTCRLLLLLSSELGGNWGEKVGMGIRLDGCGTGIG